MSELRVTKDLIIRYDYIKGEMSLEHEELTYMELMGLIEMAKLIISKDFVQDSET